MRQLKITKSITNRESASLDKYLQEIGREDLITRSCSVRETYTCKPAICSISSQTVSEPRFKPSGLNQRRKLRLNQGSREV